MDSERILSHRSVGVLDQLDLVGEATEKQRWVDYCANMVNVVGSKRIVATPLSHTQPWLCGLETNGVGVGCPPNHNELSSSQSAPGVGVHARACAH